MIRKHGVRSPLQSKDVLAKVAATNRKRYGGDRASCDPEVMNKIIDSRARTNRMNGFRSIDERDIDMFVQSLGLSTAHYASGKREIDIFIEELGIGIEFHGLYWHTEQHNRGRLYHLEKRDIAASAGIRLIQIWEHLWKSKQRQVCGFLRAALGKCTHKLGVRVCDVREVEPAEAAEFLEAYHIQGASKQTFFSLGAYSKAGELLAVCSFGKHHRGLDRLVLNRLCTKDDHVVSGFLGKAIRIASAKFKVDIYSWVDRMWSEGGSYTRAGFITDAVLKPDYMYVTKNGRQVISKQSFRKIDERTESQRSIDEGLSRAWDCGKLRFIFKYKE